MELRDIFENASQMSEKSKPHVVGYKGSTVTARVILIYNPPPSDQCVALQWNGQRGELTSFHLITQTQCGS